MRRVLLAVCASVFLAAALPGLSLAIVSDTLDQENNSTAGNSNTASDMGQTFTAGKTGLLDRVELLMGNVGGGTMAVHLWSTSGGVPDTELDASSFASPGAGPSWVEFDFMTTQPVVAGTTYAITFNLSGLTGIGLNVPVVYGSNGNAYGGGQSITKSGSSWVELVTGFDMSFRTYLREQTTSAAFSVTHVDAGTSTAVTLTETIHFPQILIAPTVVVPAAVPNWSAKIDSLPSWFNVSGISCPDSAQISLANCVLANIAPGHAIPITPTGNPLQIVLSGTVSPAYGVSGAFNATVEGCAVYVGPITSCVSAQAPIAVGAATAPPTTTSAPLNGSSSGGGIALAVAAIGAFGSLLLLGWRAKGRETSRPK